MPTDDDGTCHNVRHIAIEGSTVLSPPTQKAIVAPWQHRCLTVSHMRQLVRAISQQYLERGYVTSQAWLPEQDVSTGVLCIAITEGRIESITQEGKTSRSLALVFPGSQGRLLNLRDLEQGLEQLNRLTSQPVTIDIQPGYQPGYSRILIVSKSKAFPGSVSFSADNSGQKNTGVVQISSSATLDNPLQLADRWSLSATHGAAFQREKRNRSLSGGVTLPYGYLAINTTGMIFISLFPAAAGAIRGCHSHSVLVSTARCFGMVTRNWRSILRSHADAQKTASPSAC